MRPRVYGPRSLILTTMERPLSRSVTFAHEASGSERCAAVAVTVSRISPLAVCLPTRLYQAALPNRVTPIMRDAPQHGSEMRRHASVEGSKLAHRCSLCSEPYPMDAPSVRSPPAESGGVLVGVSPFA